MTTPIIISEINESLIDSLQSQLQSKESNLDVLLHQFFNVLVKSISQNPRKTHWSSELLTHPLFQNEKNTVIKRIATDIESGNSLHCYLSEKSNQLQQYDKSLSHYGVHHMHLGDKIQNKGSRKGRVKGTKSLLFVRFVESNAYLLGVFGHDIRTGFLNMQLFRIMYKNWPESIEQFHCKGVMQLAVKYSDEEAATLLENDVNVPVEMAKNKVYMLPGMGTTTAGTPVHVEMTTNNAIDKIKIISEEVHKNAKGIGRCIKQLTNISYNIIRLKGGVKNNLLYLYDSKSGCIFDIQQGNLVVLTSDEF